MSYEGYEQRICAKGHYFTVDAYMFDDDKRCPYCNSLSVWSNGVDQTNCEDTGYIDMKAFIIEPEESDVCNLGHRHVIKRAIYRVPSDEEKKQHMTFLTEEGNRLPLSEYNIYWEQKVPWVFES